MKISQLRHILTGLMAAIIIGVVFWAPLFTTAQADLGASVIYYVNTQGQLTRATVADNSLGSITVLDTNTNPEAVYYFAVSPNQRWLAVVQKDSQQARLSLYEASSGTLLFQQNLLAEGALPTGEAGDPATELLEAVASMVWTPDSQYLAFISAHGNPFGRPYLLAMNDLSLRGFIGDERALTAGLLAMSPEGEWLLYSLLDTFSGQSGYVSRDILAVSLQDEAETAPIRLDLPEAYPGDVLRVGWRDAATVLLSPRSFISGARGLYIWHIPTGEVQTFLNDLTEISPPVYAPQADVVAFFAIDLGINSPLEAGFYLMPLSTGEAIRVFEGDFQAVRLVQDLYFMLSARNGELLMNALQLEEVVLPASGFANFPGPGLDYILTYRENDVQITQGERIEFLPIQDALPPQWTPDGQQAALVGTYEGQRALLWLDLASGGGQVLDVNIATNSPIILIVSGENMAYATQSAIS